MYFLLCWVSAAVQAFPNCSEAGLLFFAMHRASHCSGFSLRGAQTLGPAGFSSWCTWAQELWLLGSRPQAFKRRILVVAFCFPAGVEILSMLGIVIFLLIIYP